MQYRSPPRALLGIKTGQFKFWNSLKPQPISHPPYYERALAIRLKVRRADMPVLGDEHPDTATSLNNLAFLWQSMGHTARESARPYYERALAIFEQRLGPDHPNTKKVRENLQALEGMGNREQGTGNG